jgi:hypothetical protein
MNERVRTNVCMLWTALTTRGMPTASVTRTHTCLIDANHAHTLPWRFSFHCNNSGKTRSHYAEMYVSIGAIYTIFLQAREIIFVGTT